MNYRKLEAVLTEKRPTNVYFSFNFAEDITVVACANWYVVLHRIYYCAVKSDRGMQYQPVCDKRIRRLQIFHSLRQGALLFQPNYRQKLSYLSMVTYIVGLPTTYVSWTIKRKTNLLSIYTSLTWSYVKCVWIWFFFYIVHFPYF